MPALAPAALSSSSPLPPAVKGSRFLGVLRPFRRNPPAYLESVARKYGDVVALRLAKQSAFLISDPEIIRDVLVTHQTKFKKSRILERSRVLLGDGLLTSEGEYHKRQRRLAQPAFHRDRLMGYSSAMVEGAEACVERWAAGIPVPAGAPFDVLKDMLRMTLAIVGRTLFSAHVDSEADEIGAALSQVFDMFELILLPFSEYLEKLPLPAVRRFHRARARLDKTVYRLIAEHRASGQDTGDLLSMLLLSRDEDGQSGMTDQQVRDEALTLFLAGHETTAVALTWTWYLLSQNPEAEAKFHAELDRVLAGRLPAFEDLSALRYTEHVFAESLRLFPPAWAIGRKVLTEFQAGPYSIPRDSIVLTSPWVVHRDPRWFPDPLRFHPERWEQEDATRPKFAYFPFGGGTRVCIGERFAWMEGVLLLATIGRRWRLRLVKGHPVETQARITLRPRHGMQMTAERR
jgi:cytochrome P450